MSGTVRIHLLVESGEKLWVALAVDIPLLREDPEHDPSDVADTCCRRVSGCTNKMLFFFNTMSRVSEFCNNMTIPSATRQHINKQGGAHIAGCTIDIIFKQHIHLHRSPTMGTASSTRQKLGERVLNIRSARMFRRKRLLERRSSVGSVL